MTRKLKNKQLRFIYAIMFLLFLILSVVFCTRYLIMKLEVKIEKFEGEEAEDKNKAFALYENTPISLSSMPTKGQYKIKVSTDSFEGWLFERNRDIYVSLDDPLYKWHVEKNDEGIDDEEKENTKRFKIYNSNLTGILDLNTSDSSIIFLSNNPNTFLVAEEYPDASQLRNFDKTKDRRGEEKEKKESTYFRLYKRNRLSDPKLWLQFDHNSASKRILGDSNHTAALRFQFLSSDQV